MKRLPPDIPSDPGSPVLGHLLPLRRDALGHLSALHERHGAMVHTPILGMQVVHLFGPDAMEMVYTNRSEAFSSRRGWRKFLDHTFPGSIMAMDGGEHRHHRRIMQAAFTTQALKGYLPQLNASISASIAGWLPKAEREKVLKVHPLVNALSLGIAMSAFMGASDEDRELARLANSYHNLTQATLALPINVWPTPYWKGRRARRVLTRWLAAMWEARREMEHPDLFSRLCRAASDSGERFTQKQVVDHMLFVMMAAHDTTSPAVTSLIYLLATHPEWQDRLREISFQVDSEYLEYEQLSDTAGQMAPFDWVVNEALRLYPSSAILPRVTTKPVEFDGRTIPDSTLITISAILTHRLPALWPDPDTFDPLRFAKPDPERHRFAWSPFGGGAHHCIGRRFAYLEIKSILHQLLRQYRWTVPAGYVMPYQPIPIAHPLDGLPIILRPLDHRP